MNDLNLLKLAKKNDMNAKEELIVKYTPLIRKQIKKYSYIDCYDNEDLMQYGILSILKAINTFDLDKSSSFSSYVMWTVCNNFAYLCRGNNSDRKTHSLNLQTETGDEIIDILVDETNIEEDFINSYMSKELPLIDGSKEEDMRKEILLAKEELDSIGGTVECAVLGIEPGIGNPFFDSVESTLAHLMFSIPAVKGIEFGRGFELSQMRGSEANDAMYFAGEKVLTKTNNNGGILGGITNGMPVIFKVAIKPTSSILKTQNTVNINTGENTVLEVNGRHDPCIVQRALPVVEAATAIGILDLIEN